MKHKDTKGQSFFLDTKITSDLKVATKPCGGIFFAVVYSLRMEIFVTLVKAAIAALCIFVDY